MTAAASMVETAAEAARLLGRWTVDGAKPAARASAEEEEARPANDERLVEMEEGHENGPTTDEAEAPEATSRPP